MGKGDKKSKRGKISKGSYGVRRPRKKNKPTIVATKPKKKAAPKKEVAEKAKAKPKAAAKKTTAKKPATKPKAAAKTKK